MPKQTCCRGFSPKRKNKVPAFRDTLVHLRLPFSAFLAPVYFFALSESPGIGRSDALWVFIILHLLLFPASNAYNSYYDKDEGSIGLIEKPPPVSGMLLYTAIGMDLAAIILSLLLGLGTTFTIYLVLYGLVSKAYSHPRIRLKKYPVASLLTVALFQGLYTFLAVYYTISPAAPGPAADPGIFLPALLCSCNLIAVYPLTQIYQHEEDRKHGDFTYSMLVGIGGTFRHAAVFFTLSFIGFGYLYLSGNRGVSWLLFSVFMLPAVVFFLYWWRKTAADISEASYRNTMRMNALASAGLNVFFILMCFI